MGLPAGRAIRLSSGRISGRPPKHATQNLLAGLATCGLCGGGLVVIAGGKKRAPSYRCHRARTNGTCANTLHISVAEMNEAILQIEQHVRTPEAIELVIDLSEREDVADQQQAIERERQDVEKRIARLVAAVEAAGDVAALVTKLQELETRRKAIDAELASLNPTPRLAPAMVEDRLGKWRRLLRASTAQGRAVLRRILKGRITFTPRRNPSAEKLLATTSRRRRASTSCSPASRSSGRRASTRHRWDVRASDPRTRSTRIMGDCWSRPRCERGGAPGGT